jgi:lipopolysaccharide/colanic/teichoic acid biosynthesis glycosyltransferase
VAIIVVVSMLLAARVLDPGRRRAELLPEATVVARALVPIAGLGLAWAACAPFQPLSLADLGPAALGSLLVLALGTWIVLRFEHRSRVRIAVAGPPQLARTLARELALAAIPGYQIAGWIDGGSPDSVPELRRLGSFAQIAAIVEREEIDLIVNSGGDQMEVAKVVSEECLHLDVRLTSVGQLQEYVLGEISLATIDPSFFQYLMHPTFRGGSAPLKRAIDITLAGLTLILAAPIAAFAAIAARASGPGPMHIRERRVGLYGAEFDMLRLRTADNAVGALLRRTHIDELGQLWNVIAGTMSMVGPRPELPERIAEVEERIPMYDRRMLIVPGVTGWAQVRRAEAVGDADSAWKLGHDLYYLKHRSTSLDALILLQTAVVSARGLALAGRAADEGLAHAN